MDKPRPNREHIHAEPIKYNRNPTRKKKMQYRKSESNGESLERQKRKSMEKRKKAAIREMRGKLKSKL